MSSRRCRCFFLSILLVLAVSPSPSRCAGDNPGWAALWANDYQGAVAQFHTAVEADDGDMDAWRGLLLADLAAGDEYDLVENLEKYADKASPGPFDFLLLDWIAGNSAMTGKTFTRSMADLAHRLGDDDRLDPVARRWARARELEFASMMGDKGRMEKSADKLRRISDWTLLGPFDNTSGSGQNKDFCPNFDFLPGDFHQGKFGQYVSWFHPTLYPLDGALIPTRYFHRKEFTTSYAQTRIRCPKAGTYLLSVGYEGDVDIYLDGELFHSCPHTTGGQETLHWLIDLPGDWLQIGVKINNREDEPAFSCALSMPDGSKIDHLEIDPTGTGFGPAATFSARQLHNPMFEEVETAARDTSDAGAAFWNLLRSKQEDDPGSLEALCAQAVRNHGDCGLVRMAALEVSDRKGDSQSAQIRDALEVAPALALAIRSKAAAEVEKERYAVAVQVIDGLGDRGLRNFTTQMIKEKCLEKRGLWEDAKQVAVKAAFKFPDEPEPYLAMVRYDEEMSLMDDKKDHRKQARERMAPVPRLSMEIRHNWDKEDFGSARGDIRKIRELDPSQDFLWYINILASLADGDAEDALKMDLACLESFPQSMSLIHMLANLTQQGVPLYDDLYQDYFTPAGNSQVRGLIESADPGAVPAIKKVLKQEATKVLERALNIDPGNFKIRDEISGLSDAPTIERFLPDPKVADMRSARVEPDDYPGEDAVVLFADKRRLVFDTRASMVDYVIAVQMLTVDGVADWENVDLPISPLGDAKVLAKEILKQDGGQKEGERFLSKIMFPGLAPGDIILIHYQTNELVGGNLAGNLWDQYKFAFANEPCVVSKYEILLPTGMNPQVELWNPGTYLADRYPLTEPSLGKKTKRVWRFENLPAAAGEPMSPPSLAYLPWIDISTVDSWTTIAEWYRDVAQGQADPTAGVRRKARELAPEGVTEDEAVARIFDFVANEIRYEQVSFFQSGYVPRLAEDVLEDGYGDCKDKACLMISLLKAAGFEGYRFALVTPNAPASMPFLPSPRFDHAIVTKQDADGTRHWYDPTFSRGEVDQVPRYLAGVPCLVADSGTTGLTVIAGDDLRTHPYTVESVVSLEPSGDGKIEQTETFHQVDHMAWIRQALGSDPERELRKRQTSAMAVRYPGSKVLHSRAEGLESGAGAVVLAATYRVPQLCAIDDGIISIELPWHSQLSDRFGTVVAQEERKTPVDLGSMNLCEAETLQVILPPGLGSARIPKGITAIWKGCAYRTGYSRTAKGFLATRQLVISGDEVDGDAYADFKVWLDEVRRDLARTHHLRTD